MKLLWDLALWRLRFPPAGWPDFQPANFSTMAAQPYGLIASFDTASDIYHAAQKVRDAGYKFWDCITPCPVHGLDGAMGVRRSRVPRFSLDRKSTRLNSSHVKISYAVFCLKKKKKRH